MRGAGCNGLTESFLGEIAPENKVIIEDGVAKLKDRSAFAGSVATADRLIKTLVCECDVPVPTAVKMLTEIPAKLLNMQDKIGSLEKGKNADIVVFDDAIAINAVFVGGQKI
jgi:N-acetylglucosamine-6-phosphate deacetylase